MRSKDAVGFGQPQAFFSWIDSGIGGALRSDRSCLSIRHEWIELVLALERALPMRVPTKCEACDRLNPPVLNSGSSTTQRQSSSVPNPSRKHAEIALVNQLLRKKPSTTSAISQASRVFPKHPLMLVF